MYAIEDLENKDVDDVVDDNVLAGIVLLVLFNSPHYGATSELWHECAWCWRYHNKNQGKQVAIVFWFTLSLSYYLYLTDAIYLLIYIIIIKLREIKVIIPAW